MQKKIVAVVLLAILLCSAFLLGIAYQKTQPVMVDLSGQNISVQVSYYSGDKLVDVTRHTLMLDHDQIGFDTDSAYVREYNLTQYWVRLYAINYNY